MAHVLNVPRVVNKNAKAAKQLRERGDVSVEFLKDFIWTKEKFSEHEVLLRMLGRFDLLMHHPSVHEENVDWYLVPSLLPKGVIEIDPRRAVCFDFHGLLSRLLPTLFPKLLIMTLREETTRHLALFRDAAAFVLDGVMVRMDIAPSTSSFWR